MDINIAVAWEALYYSLVYPKRPQLKEMKKGTEKAKRHTCGVCRMKRLENYLEQTVWRYYPTPLTMNYYTMWLCKTVKGEKMNSCADELKERKRIMIAELSRKAQTKIEM